VTITAHTLTTAAGCGNTASFEAIRSNTSGLRPNDFEDSRLDTWIGRVAAADVYEWPDTELGWRSRNNALAAIGLQQDGFLSRVKETVEKFGSTRVGVVIGTSTSSIGRTEHGYRELKEDRMLPEFHQPLVHNPHSPTAFVAGYCDIDGPQMTISTACSSSAKVFATAARWLQAGVVDAVLVGGVDSLCLSVLHGFHALELVSEHPCRPFDANRDGINLGEAAGFAILTSTQKPVADAIVLSGFGESSDAWHMSHPHPEGAGAETAMRDALSCARLQANDIDYINFHGTASRANDTIEANVVARLFSPAHTRGSSTKGWTGHTLGAAGIVEVLITIEALNSQYLPGTRNLTNQDPKIAFPIQCEGESIEITHVMSNSFGFGGNNCVVICSKNATTGSSE